MKKKLTTTAIFSLLPMLVFCHGSHGSGVMAGFTHPIFGWDHNLVDLVFYLMPNLIKNGFSMD